MTNINDLFSIPYYDGDLSKGMNCWDLVVFYYREFLNKDLKQFKIKHDDKKAITKEFKEYVQYFEEGFQEGAIACVFVEDYLHHIGVVCGGRVLHTTEKLGVRRDTRLRFESLGERVVYYHD